MQYFRTFRKHIKEKRVHTIIAAILLVTITSIGQATVVVIANPSSPITNVTKTQLSAAYLGKPSTLPSSIAVYNQPDNTASYAAFYQDIMGWDADQVNRYWAQQVFSGIATQPPVVSDDAAAIALVQQTQTAIAYVDSDSLEKVGNTVKVIYGNYTIPAYHAPQPSESPAKLYSSSKQEGYMSAIDENSPPTNTPANNSDSQLTKQIGTINSNQSSQNLWSLISSNMTLQGQDNNPRVSHWIAWFQRHPKVLGTMIDNASPYLYYIFQQTQRYHVPAEFALLPMIESGYNPHAYSSAGAAGLWQLMPSTASNYRIQMNWWYDSRLDILKSTQAALNFLAYLHKTMGSWELAAAAYNEGPGALQSGINRNKRAGLPADYWSLNLNKQTAQYVPKLLALSAIIANPSQYGLTLPNISNQPFFAGVTLGSQMTLPVLSQLSGLTVGGIEALNPSIRRVATAPDGNFTLLLPITSINTFVNNYQQIIGKPCMNYHYHKVHAGETLSTLATTYNTTSSQIMQLNTMTDVKAGDSILVPINLNNTYTKLVSISGTSTTAASQSQDLTGVLKRATESQKIVLPKEVTGQPIKSSDNLKSLVDKLYGND
jgi:membrane-bound lytic murein transglycosylase D